MIRAINNLIRTLLFQDHLPPIYWVEALNMATHLLNILPSTAINNEIPFEKLFNKPPPYSELRVFGCLCYPHLETRHKLQPRSTPCVFLGYPSNHRGYRCLDLQSKKIIISRHVNFDESVFFFNTIISTPPPTYTFLDDHDEISPIFKDILQSKHRTQFTAPNPPTQPTQPTPPLNTDTPSPNIHPHNLLLLSLHPKNP